MLLSLALVSSAHAQVQPLPPDFVLFGKTAGDYAAEYFQFAYSLSTNGDYLRPYAGAYGSEPVFFLQRALIQEPVPGVQNYFIPDNVYLFIPLFSYVVDNVDTGPPPLTAEQLRDVVEAIVNSVTNVHATIDGLALTNLSAYRGPTPLFSLELDNPDNIYSANLGRSFTGLIDPLVGDGYFLMIPPLPVGVHDFRTGAFVPPPVDIVLDRHYQVNVIHVNRPPVADASSTPTRVVASTGGNARVLLLGARSSDPDGDPISYSWFDGSSPLAEGPRAATILAVGTHTISLVVNDGTLSATNIIAVDVITPCEAVAGLASRLETAPLPRKKLKSLLEELQEACAAFEHGLKHHDRHEHLEHAVHELVEFQHEVREQLRHRDAAVASSLIAQAQEIIDAVSKPRRHEHGDEDDDGDNRK